MMIRFIGDVHGKFRQYKSIIEEVPRSIQVGDMGVGFYIKDMDGNRVSWANPPYDAISKGDHKFIRGNHDNPAVCAQQDYYIPDGSTYEGMMFVGGALSIDRMWRTQGWDWWADEEVSPEQFKIYREVYANYKPKIMVTHECPHFISKEILQAFNKVKFNDPSHTPIELEQMYDLHQPKLWIFGHWHHSLRVKFGETEFVCLNELEYMDINLEDF